MVDSQPGKVAAFVPSPTINLTDFTAGARDRFLFNENQLVLAKIQAPKPVAVEIGTYNNYVNLLGEFALIDGSFYALETSGVPLGNEDEVKISFDQQVTTGSIKFWTLQFTTSVTLSYSFDDITWFSVGPNTLTQERDESLEKYPGESPATGQYVYTATFDDGQFTGRYWKIAGGSSFANNLTEINILPNTGPILEHWNSNGSKAVTNSVEGTGYYDITYDKADEVYYAIRFDDTLPTSLVLDPDDDFNGAGLGSLFDSTKWEENEEEPYFIRSVASGTLGMKSSAGRGRLTSRYGVDGSTLAEISVVAVNKLGPKANFSLAVESKDYKNHYAVASLIGPYTSDMTPSGTIGAVSLQYSDTVGAAAVLQDFRINPTGIDYDFPGGVIQYDFIYDAGTNKYAITASGVTTWPDASPGEPYAIDSAEFTISNVFPPADGQGFSVTATCASTPVLGTAASGIRLEIERVGSNGFIRYENSDSPGTFTLLAGNIPEEEIRVEISGNPNDEPVDLSADAFTLTGGTLSFSSPVFSVVTINKDGNLEQVPSVSDADGYAIKIFDVIQDLSASYNNYLYPRVAISTNGALHGAGGEVYIKVNDTLYKYTKASMPIVSENGSSASIVTVGEIPEIGIVNFSYSGYSQGGLSYIEYIPDLSGTFIKTISTTSLLASPFKALLDVSTVNHPFAWNVTDGSTLYFIDNDDELKLYDLNEAKAGFVNVTSNKQVLAAGTSETATITAQVLNVYGEPKSAKTMAFSVSAGDGAVSPFSGCSDGSGKDTTTYTVGAAVGTATLTVTVSDISCP